MSEELMSQLSRNIFVGSLSDAIRWQAEFSIICVLESRPLHEPEKAIHIPGFKIFRDGKEVNYAELRCPEHQISWYEHGPEQVLADKESKRAGVYDTKSNASIEVKANLENLRSISDILRWTDSPTIVQCLAGIERAPATAAFHFARTLFNDDLQLGYDFVKIRHPETMIRTEWFR